MRVPSIGLTLDERRITREGMLLAERMLRNYPDAPSDVFSLWLAGLLQMMRRAFVRS